MKPLNIIGISGSLRSASLNTKLLRQAISKEVPELTITEYPLKDIPLFNGDLESDGDPEQIRDFKEAIQKSDGVLIVTPEYHQGIPGVLKNALDWAGSDANENMLNGHFAGVIGATPTNGGTAGAQQQVISTLKAAGATVMEHSSLKVAKAPDKFEENGQLQDKETDEALISYLNTFADWLRKKI
ncbi:NADPH-dependent FMN reductase [Geomicrobium sp. JCM 19039]|uniref:NADPH-dependent FMN reductase n=1 Tax=Geomicrobium sp. JCM 19039 TaxID=1460636 RepID=UPI00045F2027|nr:NADPH-dependent FMN reductase [Geomicrobium sp. JCM 19039]GAK11890.1 NADPH:quinone oxidoreductase [Geomicrobium sp. JCM 19039]